MLPECGLNPGPLQGIRQGNGRPGYRGGTGPAIGLDDVTIHSNRPLAEGPGVYRSPQGTSDQTLDFHGAPTLFASRGFPVNTGVSRSWQHAVLGRHPANALTSQESGHRILYAGGTDNLGATELH
jgi:hypothetical protein